MKNTISVILAVLALAGCSRTSVDVYDGPELSFKDGKFKIAQFTDMHWNNDDRDTLAIIKTIHYVAETEKPDLIVFTGDNVTSCGTQEGNAAEIKHLAGVMDAIGIPYVLLPGNHDAEACEGGNADLVEKWIVEYAKGCINYPTTSDCYGHGNKAIPVIGEKSGKPEAVLYMIDSNDYPQNPEYRKFSYYDWIHYDQIDWYRRQSDHYIAGNGGEPLPALAFFHICLPEYNFIIHDSERFGAYTEALCPASVNTGMFAASKMQGDIMGYFVGHDHCNDFCGIYNGVALCYGRQSGAEEWDPLAPLGARIIELTEGERSFETWCVTINGREATWYYPSAFNSTLADNALPAQEVSGLKPGVSYRYYEGGDADLSTVAMNTPAHFKKAGVAKNFDISLADADDHFGFDFSGWFNAPEDGAYCFLFSTDDGAVLKIDGEVVIDQDGDHGQSNRFFTGLKKGFHKIDIAFFENYGGQHLDLSYRTLTSEWKPVADNELFTK